MSFPCEFKNNKFGLPNDWTFFERILLVLSIGIAFFITLYKQDSILNLVILATGISCVILTAKGSPWSFIFGIVNTLLYSYIVYLNGLYGELGLNLLFFFPMNIIGYILWESNSIKNKVIIGSMNRSIFATVLILSVLFSFLLGKILANIKSQNNSYFDASATILSITATIFTVMRYKEQWVFYIALNLLTISIWCLRAYQGSKDGSVMILMWLAFLANALYGYSSWNKPINCQNQEYHSTNN